MILVSTIYDRPQIGYAEHSELVHLVNNGLHIPLAKNVSRISKYN